jgi:hypothetical protein
LYNNGNGRFVRFNLQLDQNEQPLVAPNLRPAAAPVSVYEKDNFKTLKIPVSLTSQPLSEAVEISFSTAINGLNDVSIIPASTLTFNGSQLVDTLFVKVNQRIDPSLNPSIRLDLVSSSDPEINIGVPNDQFPNNSLLINFVAVDPIYALNGSSRIELQGIEGETKDITLDFPNGFTAAAVQDLNLFNELQSNFPYTITQQSVTSEDQIKFTLTLDAALTDDSIPYLARLQINDIPDYTNTGVTEVAIFRNPQVDREVSTNTASNLYNTADSFYRLYGVNWMDFNEDGVCEWRDFNTFTIPVVVDYVAVGTDPYPNGVFIDDRGTNDISDDLYHHAFQIGFQAPTNTTNPFNLRRWFTNESTNPTISTGLNIVPAIEFFPDGGSSTTGGIVRVVEQTLVIGTTASNGNVRELIPISGAGTYSEISPGVYDIEFELNATNNRLFGGTLVVKYHLYNVNNFTDPPLLNESCFMPIIL